MSHVPWLLPFIIAILAVIAGWYLPSHRWQSTQPAPNMARHQNQQENNRTQRSPYNEDEIVKHMKSIYRIYLKLNYIKRWELVWPPKGTGHAINEALCKDLGLDPAVISLMKQLPYLTNYQTTKQVEFYTYSRAMVYLEDDEIRGGRDPNFFEFQKPRLDYLLPHEITLICDGDEGSNVILDVKGKTIRVETFHGAPPGPGGPPDYDYQPERTDDRYYYRNYYAHHAPTWLASWLQKVTNLDVIPVNELGDRQDHEDAFIVKDILKNKYGYPDHFREAEWRRVGATICWKVGRYSMGGWKVPDTYDFEFDARGEEEEDMRKSVSVVYAEDIDGPDSAI
ncbi:hypothetical protein BJX65DRAFT_279437 [Aspergillus insuetus]